MYNFSAGPACLPEEVLIRARDEMLDWHGSGMSVMEMPFTSDEYRQIESHASRTLRDLVDLPDNYHILFLQGGAYAHFAILAMNLGGNHGAADYVQTGHWSTRAINEAGKIIRVNIAAGSEASGFDHIPAYSEWNLDPDAAYCHITTNETASGLQYHWLPDTGAVPLVADATSDFLSRRIDITKFGLLYASAQKNIGPTGLTVIIIRDDLLDRGMDILPAVFNYGLQARNNSRINTPPTWSIYMAGLVFSWLKERGGLDAMEKINREKAGRLYDYIDSDHYYRCHIAPVDRSLVNVCFSLADDSMTDVFIREADTQGLRNLRGHAQQGAIRASLYNAMPVESVDALVEFMRDFSSRHAVHRRSTGRKPA